MQYQIEPHPSKNLKKMNSKNSNRDKNLMENILAENQIQMSVGGCGCCNSPWVSFSYKGHLIFEGENASFDTKHISPGKTIEISIEEYQELQQAYAEYTELKKWSQ